MSTAPWPPPPRWPPTWTSYSDVTVKAPAWTPRSKKPWLCNDLRHDPRWPDYSASALQAGVHATLSFKLYTHQYRPTQRAALNLVSRQPEVFDPDAQSVAAMLATNAAITLIAQDRDAQFHSALASRDAIGQATGMIIERFGIDAQAAFELLKRLSQNSNTRIVDVAAQIVAAGPHR